MEHAALIKLLSMASVEAVNMWVTYKARVEAGELTPEQVEAEIDAMIAGQNDSKAVLDAAAARVLGNSE